MEPYRLLFPLGILWGMGGVLVWFFFHLRLFPFYPGGVHAEIMIGGFYLTIAAGFLMTAIPRLSGTATASTVEKTAALLASLAGFAVVWKTNRFFFHAILLLQLLLLIRFATKRLFKGPFAPAPPFVLTAFGNLSALAGIVILLINDFHPCSPPLLTAARGLFFYGFFLGGVLGIGSLLIPMILGAGNLPQSPTPLSTTVSRLPHIGKFSLLGLSLAGSFFVDAYVGIRWGSLIRAIVVGILLLKWPLFQRPPKGILYWMLWLSGWILLVGFWPAVLRPDLALHTNHTIFIGTVSLMIFGIATRVTLAHGGADLLPEKKSKALTAVLILLLAATITRIGALYFPAAYFSHLAYASLLWTAAALVWLVRFFRILAWRGT